MTWLEAHNRVRAKFEADGKVGVVTCVRKDHGTMKMVWFCLTMFKPFKEYRTQQYRESDLTDEACDVLVSQLFHFKDEHAATARRLADAINPAPTDVKRA